jgi:hypothetical protein
MEINNKLKINEYVSIAQLKRKIKAYLVDQGNSDFKPSIFAQGLIVCLVMVLEELIADCLKDINKEKSGLYTINQLIISNLFNSSDKYNFASKYIKKYSPVLRYHESIFFNINKVINNLEDKHGSKLMIDSEAKNIICYIILSLQYDIVGLSVNMVKYANRKTLNINVLEIVCSYIISNDISNKIKLKLDSINISNNDIDNEESEGVSDVEVEDKVEIDNKDKEEDNKDKEEDNKDNEEDNKDNEEDNKDNEDEVDNNQDIKNNLANNEISNDIKQEVKKSKDKKNAETKLENLNNSINLSSNKIIKETKEDDKLSNENTDKSKKNKSKSK